MAITTVCVCSRKDSKNKLCNNNLGCPPMVPIVNLNQQQVTDEQKREILSDFFNKYCFTTQYAFVEFKLEFKEELIGKNVEVKTWDGFTS